MKRHFIHTHKKETILMPIYVNVARNAFHEVKRLFYVRHEHMYMIKENGYSHIYYVNVGSFCYNLFLFYLV